MIHNKRVPRIDGLRIDEAHKGGKGSTAPSAAQVAAEEAQSAEMKDLQAKETSRTEAMGRKRRGRASLISGEETGLKETLGS